MTYVVELIEEVMDDKLWGQPPRRLEMAIMRTNDDAICPEYASHGKGESFDRQRLTTTMRNRFCFITWMREKMRECHLTVKVNNSRTMIAGDCMCCCRGRI
jgi:hypothetical protein